MAEAGKSVVNYLDGNIIYTNVMNRLSAACYLIQRIASRSGLHKLEHAEEIGFGSRAYEMVSIDD